MKNEPTPKPTPWNPSQLLRDDNRAIIRPSEDQQQRFAKVVAGGRVTGIDSEKPYLERMVTGASHAVGQQANQLLSKSKEQAILESVSSNLEAGIQIIDHQETALAKIGGKLSDIALCLNRVKNPKADEKERFSAQATCLLAKKEIKNLSQSTYDHAALFSNGPSKPITIAVPTQGEWEGLSVEKCDLSKPGFMVVNGGKVYGTGPGVSLDHGSISRAFSEWRNLCVQNRMQWSLLVERLQGICKTLKKVSQGGSWNMPEFPKDPKLGPLRRPHRNN
jgi:hypothetical protein